jgi:hypothetical protein
MCNSKPLGGEKRHFVKYLLSSYSVNCFDLESILLIVIRNNIRFNMFILSGVTELVDWLCLIADRCLRTNVTLYVYCTGQIANGLHEIKLTSCWTFKSLRAISKTQNINCKSFFTQTGTGCTYYTKH